MSVVAAEPRVGGLSPGTRFGHYAVVRRIARGGMAELYLARHATQADFGKLFVVKRVLPHLAESAEFVQMFQNEARLASTLNHPNVAQVVDYGVAGEDQYLVMEYVHGQDVRAILRAASERHGFDLAGALTIVSGVASALHYAHELRDDQGALLEIVHRDVSPSNVIVSYDGAVRLADFGIAKAVARTRVTRTGTVKGKAGYMSPEQCRGEEVDRRSDVFGLGVMLYELTTLRRVFFAPGDLAIMSKVVRGEFRPPTDIDPAYPPALERIVMRALAVDPALRHPTADALCRDVESLAAKRGLRLSPRALASALLKLFEPAPYPTVPPLVEPPPSTATAHAPVPAPMPPPARGWRLPVLGAAALGVGGFLLGISLAGDDAPPPEGAAASESRDAPPTVTAPAAPQPRVVEPAPPPETPPAMTVEPAMEPTPPSGIGKDKEARPRPKNADKRRRRTKASRSPGSAAKHPPRTFGPPEFGK